MWLTLIRHAEPAYVSGGRAWSDPPLTERGHEQARLVGERATRWNVDEVWVSNMVRARETAEPVAEATGVKPEVMEWLGEIRNPPEWDGSPADEIEDYFASSHSRTVEEMWEGVPGGESFRSFHERIHGGLQSAFADRDIRQTEERTHLWSGVDERRIVVVAHGGTNALILGMLLGVEPTPWEWDRFTHVHSGVSRLVSQPTAGNHAWSLRALSDRSHLPPDMVTA